MYVIGLKGKATEGLYAAPSQTGKKILYMFSDSDDAKRFAGLLEADDYPELQIYEIEDDVALKICQQQNYSYFVIDSDDLLIPPDYHDSF